MPELAMVGRRLLRQGRHLMRMLVVGLSSCGLLLVAVSEAGAWVPPSEDFLVDRVVLHCPAAEQARTIVATELCSQARTAIERLSRGDINPAVLGLAGWQHVNDPSWPEQCRRHVRAPLPGQCEAIFFHIFATPVRFPVLTAETLSRELLQDTHTLVLRLRTTLDKETRCPAGKMALRLEIGPVTEIFPPQELKDAEPLRDFYSRMTVYRTDIICIGVEGAAHHQNVEEMMVGFARYFSPFKMNMMSINRSNRARIEPPNRKP